MGVAESWYEPMARRSELHATFVESHCYPATPVGRELLDSSYQIRPNGHDCNSLHSIPRFASLDKGLLVGLPQP